MNPHRFERWEGQPDDTWCKHCNTEYSEVPGLHMDNDFRDNVRRAIALDGMTYEVWRTLSQRQRDYYQDRSQLSPQLTGKEGWLVRVWDDLDPDTHPRLFIIGVSTGWRPIHLEVPNNSRSHAGAPASRHYARIEFVKFKR